MHDLLICASELGLNWLANSVKWISRQLFDHSVKNVMSTLLDSNYFYIWWDCQEAESIIKEFAGSRCALCVIE